MRATTLARRLLFVYDPSGSSASRACQQAPRGRGRRDPSLRGQWPVRGRVGHDLRPLPLWRRSSTRLASRRRVRRHRPPAHHRPVIDRRHATTDRETQLVRRRVAHRVPAAHGRTRGRAHLRRRAAQVRDARRVIGESGIGWLPYVLERMDDQWSHGSRISSSRCHRRATGTGRCRPRSRVDEAGLLLADRIGVAHLMWGNDFPHGDGVWPDSRAVIDKQFASIPDTTRRAITYDNAARLYGFPPPRAGARRPRTTSSNFHRHVNELKCLDSA